MGAILGAMAGGRNTVALPRIDDFSASGTATVPAGATNAVIEVWGASGNGGGTGASIGGGGGGSGGYCRTSLAVVATKTLVITIGASGSSTTVASGTQAITTMSAGTGFDGQSGNGSAAGGSAGLLATGGTVTNSAGIAGTGGSAAQVGGAGAPAVTGVNGSGSPGGHGGNVFSSGQNGHVTIKYT
jgi:hypothetical protein